ncbi:hypothetical protein M8C21_015127 [Ambrosia artemisiifolia]|uniref:DUF4378 domain-containing protein n=1 Tax=Ambrosia artemisiifolia TaxID=4212 RepID=A0AAD5GDX9_AMBAR|nr:hypothetical protein M8C21_015127 [Ambrosia artemisiifolia]
MGHKHLHELLKEDQEPFHLKTFISHHRSLLKTTTTTTITGKTSLNIKKHKPIIKNNFCINHVCLLSIQNSPDIKNSPFLDFPAKKPPEFNNATGIYLHIPATTAAKLVEAAGRVQKPKPGLKQTGFGLLGSFLRRFKDRTIKTKNRETGPTGPVNGTLLSSPAITRSWKKRCNEENGLCESCNECRVSSGEWSEKSSEFGSSCSTRSVHEFEDININVDQCFCSNPESPFRFSLQRSPLSSPSPSPPVPDFTSSVASPSRCFKQDKESHDVEDPQENNREKDEEEKEQCSPVSVLDTLFDDGDEEEEHEGGATQEDYDIECSYANVQRAKHQLLQKLQRFERLAGLDPIKLENHMLEQCYSDDEDVLVNGEEVSKEELFKEIVNHLGVGKIPWFMKKLVFDLIEEENKNEEHDVIVQKVCKRLHSWKVVELNTIDMMVETEFRSEGWKRCDEETIKDMVMDIEVAIFGFLVEELAQ